VNVWSLTIWFRGTGETENSLHTTRWEARQILAKWVWDRWRNSSLWSEQLPSGHADDDIITFFERYGEDYEFAVVEKEVLGPVKHDPDILDLTPWEVQVLLSSLRIAHPGIASTKMGCPDRSQLVANTMMKLINEFRD